MALKAQGYKIKGMSQDQAKSMHSPDTSFENKNIRITSREGHTFLSIENEKGNAKYSLHKEFDDSVITITGTVLGNSIIADKIVLFVHDTNAVNNPDSIYKIYTINKSAKKAFATQLFNGNLGFSINHPIDTIPFYENENIQKVYWTDGLNQPRVINIMNKSFLENSFDFTPSVNLIEEINITKIMEANGIFPVGTVQYAFTYIGKNGQESNIFYQSPLYNTSQESKGNEVNDTVNNAFNIVLKKLDSSFKYVRIYSIVRTSIDATPIVKKVVDIDLSDLQVITEIIPGEDTVIPNSISYDIIMNYNYTTLYFSSTDSTTVYMDILSLQRGTTVYDVAYSGSNFIYKLPTDTYWNWSNTITLQNGDIITFPKTYMYSKVNGLDLSKFTMTIVSGSENINVLQDVIRKYTIISIPDSTTVTFTNAFSSTSGIDDVNTIPNNTQFNIESTNTTSNFLLVRILNEGVTPPTSSQTTAWLNANTTEIYLYFTFPMFYTDTGNGLMRTYLTNDLFIYRALGFNNIFIKTPLTLGTRILIGNFSITNNPYNINYNAISIPTKTIEITLDNEIPTFDNMSFYKILFNNSNNITIIEDSFVSYIDQRTISYVGTSFIDTNNIGELVSSTHLLYVGGQDIVAQTMTNKDNLLFLGNIKLNKPLVNTSSSYNFNLLNISFYLKDPQYSETVGGLYDYKVKGLSFKNTLDEYESHRGFKSREWYRFGLQFQYKTGEWSEVYHIKDEQVNINPAIVKNGNTITMQGIAAKTTLNFLIPQIVARGFTRVRGVVVLPTDSDKSVIAQGVLNSTLFNVVDRYQHIPDVIPSWIFRPMYSKYNQEYIESTFNSKYGDSGYTIGNGSRAEYRHYYSLSGGNNSNAEIQSNESVSWPGYAASYNNTLFKKNFSDAFFIDNSIITLHSPDIEFGKALKENVTSNLKLRIIGFTGINGFNSSLSITNSTGFNGPYAQGFVNPNQSLNTWVNNVDGGKMLLAGGYIHSLKSTNYVRYVSYPWQGNGSLCGYTDNTKGTLKEKKWSNLRYSDINYYFDYSGANGPIEVDIADTAYFNPNQSDVLKLPICNNAPYAELLYQGNVDKVITFGGSNKEDYDNYYIDSPSDEIGTFLIDQSTFKDSIRIQYKSTSHAVLQLNWDTPTVYNDNPLYQQKILPGAFNNTYKNIAWKDDTNIAVNRISDRFPPIQALTDKSSGVWLAELYRDDVDIVNRFGGTSIAALQANQWIPAGEPVSLLQDNQTPHESVEILFTEGDTYFQRYDCLKTYGEQGYQQSVVDILSFICETRVNLDARIDSNRGLIDNRLMNPDIFNLFNPVYNQKNNYFNNVVIDHDLFSLNKFTNTFTWTGNKTTGALVDNWTNVDLIGTYDVNGGFGEIRALKLFNDYLIGFQDKGLFNILYNSRVQLNTSDGIPIELGISNKVDGIKYLSTTIGTKNKQSVEVTPSGIYFIDDEAKTINLFNGQVNIISDNAGMRSWLKTNHMFNPIYDMNNLSNFITHYDKINKDIYFINKDFALCYSELLQTFTSFYDYNNTANMFNISDGFFSIQKDLSLTDNEIHLWEQNAGSYNKFFNVNKGFYIKYLVNPEPTLDKIFDTIDLRADVFNSSNIYLPGVKPFSSITAQTEYQNATQNTNDTNFKQKFRVWRGLIPRANSINSDVFFPNVNKLTGVDRIRNPWAFITLEKSADTDNNRMVLQDTIFHYTV